MAKKTDYYKKLGNEIAKLRKEADISQKKMSDLIGLDGSLISRFENQGEKLPTERINEMLDVLGYELKIVEKKKPADSQHSVKKRIRQLLQAAEEALEELDNGLRPGAPSQEHQPHTNHDQCFEPE